MRLIVFILMSLIGSYGVAQTYSCEKCKLMDFSRKDNGSKPCPIPEKPDPKPEEPRGDELSKCYKASSSICKIESLIIAKTNKLRAANGKTPYKTCWEASFVARDWSQKQSSSNKISHDGFAKARNAVFKAEFGVNQSFRAENVAMFGSSLQDTGFEEKVAEKFYKMWSNSSGHKRNMLANLESIGTGVVIKKTKSYYKVYATQLMLNKCR